MDKEMFKITVLIAGNTYPLTIRREEEEIVRKAAKMINDKLNYYRERYNLDKEKTEKYLSMVALDLAVNYSRLKDEKDTVPITDRLKDLDLQLEEYLGL